MQGYTNVDAQKIRVHFAQLVLSICSGLHFSYRPDAFGDQQLESLTLRRVAMTQTLLQAFGEHTPESNLESQRLLVPPAPSLDTGSTISHSLLSSERAPPAVC